MPTSKLPLKNRELSWLSFNARVLQEAADPAVPLLERLRFLGIFSSNLDEFFRIRVATVRRLVDLREKTGRTIPGYPHPAKVLSKIQHTVIGQERQFDAIYRQVVAELAQHNIHFCNDTQLDAAAGNQVKAFFTSRVLPMLVPVMLGNPPRLPELTDHSLYLVVRMSRSDGARKARHALIEIPVGSVPRFLVLPPQDGRQIVVLLDDVIRYCLRDLFYMFDYDQFQAYAIKLTRDADLTLDQNVQDEDLPQRIVKSLKQRRRGRPVRLVHDAALPRALLKSLMRGLRFSRYDAVIAGSRYHNFKDFIAFPRLAGAELHYPALRTVPHPGLPPRVSVQASIDEKDRLLHYPYQSFDAMIRFLRESAIDPEVKAIKMTLYRAAKDSRIVNALINAVRNGKAVTVVVELQARFNEEENLALANRLTEEGAKVIFGRPGVKIHCKMTLVTKARQGRTWRYCNLATGNYNELTGEIYCDDSLFTSDPRLTVEVSRLFHQLEGTVPKPAFEHLLVAPRTLRVGLEKLIDAEIREARRGRPASILLKLNNLSDPEIIEWLYRASQAGVEIRLIVRGICCLVPGGRGAGGRIQAISIVDRFLEHSRVFVFGNGGRPKVYMASADLMPRNLDYRVEVAWPVYDEDLKRELIAILELQWRDNTKARVLNRAQNNRYRDGAGPPVRTQTAMFDLLRARRSLAPLESPAPRKPT